MDLYTLYHRTLECWAERVNAVAAGQWDDLTPCTEWSVRDLVNHVVGEDLWTVPLMRGRTIEDVGTAFDGDVLGEDPIGRALQAAAEARSVVAETLPRGEKVHLSYGEEDAGEYIRQLAADHLVHAWDVAAATGGKRWLDPQLVSEVKTWFAQREELYRAGGIVGPRGAPSGEPQNDLLAAFGRDARWGPNHAALRRMSAAFASGDVDAIMALMTDDVVFESTEPAPDGQRHEGVAAVRRVWERFFTESPQPRFSEEESFVCGDRAVLRWTYSWGGDGRGGHVRGTDVLRMREGKVAEKLSYVKG